MVKSDSYLRRRLLQLADSSIVLKKDSKVESWNKKHLGKRLQEPHLKYIKNIELGILFDTGKYLWEKGIKNKMTKFFYLDTGHTIHKKHYTRRQYITKVNGSRINNTRIL